MAYDTISRLGPLSAERKRSTLTGAMPKTAADMRASSRNLNRKLSVAEMMSMASKGGPDMSNIKDVATGKWLSSTEANDRAPQGGYVVSGYKSGSGRGHGGGFRRPQAHISSTGVAGGVPTGQRGRAALAMQNDPTLDPMTAWMDAEAPAHEQASNDFYNNAFDMPTAFPKAVPPPEEPLDWAGNLIKPKVNAMGNLSLGFAEGTKDSGKDARVAVVGEKGPETLVIPPHSKVIPYAAGAGSGLDGAGGPRDGERRQDADGNWWRYDAKTGRGVPENPYIGGNTNRPTRVSSFDMTPDQRYDDLAMRLTALRQEGLASARARIAEAQAKTAAEDAQRQAFLATGKPVPTADGGGVAYKTPYGTAIVGGNRPKSFTVENFEGGQTSGSLAEADRESRVDAAERAVRGLGLKSYTGYGTPRTALVPEPISAVAQTVAPTDAEAVSALDALAEPTVTDPDEEESPIAPVSSVPATTKVTGKKLKGFGKTLALPRI